MEFSELVRSAFAGPNAYVYALLNVVAFGAHRMAIISQTWAFSAVCAIGAMLGALGGLIEAQATVGVAPTVLGNAVLVGLIVGAGSATVIGFGISKGLDALGVAPISAEKKKAEDIRDPMSPTQP